MILNDDELLNVKGSGGSGFGIAIGIGAAITFLIGALDGFFNPKRCEI